MSVPYWEEARQRQEVTRAWRALWEPIQTLIVEYLYEMDGDAGEERVVCTGCHAAADYDDTRPEGIAHTEECLIGQAEAALEKIKTMTRNQ